MSRLSQEQVKRVIFLYQKRTAVDEIATEVLVTKWAVYYQIQKYKERGYTLKYKTFPKSKTEVRFCTCEMQDCRGRYISKTESAYTVCCFEAVRLGLCKTISDYYK